jgi:hypothetical protein
MSAVDRLVEAYRWRRSAAADEHPYGYRLPRQGVALPALVALVLVGAVVGGWLGTGVGHGSAAPTQSFLSGPSATPTPADEFAAKLKTAVDRLATARANGRLELSGAGAPAAQVVAATKLAAAYRTAARRIGPLSSGAPAGQARVLAALQAAAKGYAMLAAAARAGDAAGYDRAVKAVSTAEGELQQLIGSHGSIA